MKENVNIPKFECRNMPSSTLSNNKKNIFNKDSNSSIKAKFIEELKKNIANDLEKLSSKLK